MVVGIDYRKCEDKQRKKVGHNIQVVDNQQTKMTGDGSHRDNFGKTKKFKLGPTIYSMYYNVHCTYLGMYISDLRKNHRR